MGLKHERLWGKHERLWGNVWEFPYTLLFPNENKVFRVKHERLWGAT